MKKHPKDESKFKKCPHCGERTKFTFNWIHGDDGMWYHECLECENVIVTNEKIIETNAE